MKTNNILFFNKEKKIDALLSSTYSTNNIYPIIDIFINDSFLYMDIFYYGLKKREFSIDYINNFIVLTLSFDSTISDDIFISKRIFYYKNLDFYNYKSQKHSNIVSLKIPFTA